MGLLGVVMVVLLASVAHGARPQRANVLQKESDPDECAPQQVHIALTDDASGMAVTWKTAGANCPSEVSWWLVRAGDGSEAPAGTDLQTAVGFSFLLSERDMCDAPAAINAFAVYLHRTVMTGLSPGGRYRYRLAGAAGSWPFRAALASAPDEKFSFVAFGDLGDGGHAAAKSPGAALTLAAVQAREMPWLDLALHVGDISYANGDPDVWDTFMESIEPLAARVPYMVQVGNHEYGYDSGSATDPSGAAPYQPGWGNFGADSGGECGAMVARRFAMPGRRGDNPPFWYGFDYGSVHFTAVSTEHDLAPGSPQHAWLEAELASVDRCATPWLVLLLHRPAYVVYPHKSNREVGDHLRAFLEPLLRRHLVDAAISGHVHSYYRSCPAHGGACVGGGGEGEGESGGANGGHGTVHIVVGSGGHVLSALEEGQEEWVAAVQRTWGYARFAVESPARMRVQFVGSEGAEVLDAFDLDASPARLAGACPAGGPAAAAAAAAPAS
ncbi:MAG: metallophosphoesterase [Monoraphidium minutum]|nr:MAG: metallophosphoesterase [Monoraphidium minutum]